MEIFNNILLSYAMYCCKKMVKILKCYLIIPKKSLSKGSIFLANPVLRCSHEVTLQDVVLSELLN